MWVASGPFDNVQDGTKEKLLKPGKTYVVGRPKSADGPNQVGRLNIDSKSISHEHIHLIVGSYDVDDVSDPQMKPTIQLVVKRKKDIWVNTAGQRVSEGTVHDLESGDEIGLTNKITMYVLWKPVVVVNADNRVKKDRIRQLTLESSKLGITISKAWMSSATHYATQSINMSRRPLHCLMLAIPLVDTRWLEEVFRRGNTLTIESDSGEDGVVALESHFVLPDVRDFRPQLQPADDEDENVTEWPIELWDAEPRRKSMWKGIQFHFFCDGAPPTEWIDQAQLGGATFECHNYNPENEDERITNLEQADTLFRSIQHSASKLGKVAGMRSPVVIVIKPAELVTAMGKQAWEAYQKGMKNHGFKYVTPKDVTHAVLDLDIASIDCGIENSGVSSGGRNFASAASSSLPSVVPPSHAGDVSITGPLSSVGPSAVSGAPGPSEAAEPTTEPARSRLLKRRPRPASPVLEPPGPAPAPVVQDDDVEPIKAESTVEPPRPLLKRRGKPPTVAEMLGLDDSNASINPNSIPAPKPPLLKKRARVEPDNEDSPPPVEVQPEAPRTNRLKRRADVLSERAAAAATSPADSEPIEVREGHPALKRFRGLFEGTQRAASTVISVAEDAAGGNRKRKSADRDEDDDVEMTEPKRRAVVVEPSEPSGQDPPPSEPSLEPNQSQSAVQRPKPGVAHTRAPGAHGAAPGEPDKDATLLEALQREEGPAATSSKGKATAIDKEFANMRIAQENEEKEAASRRRAEEMRIWEECERNVDVRGNFMVIELVDLVRRRREPTTRSVNPAWEGTPDFKKFKRKVAGPRGPRVAVFVNDEDRPDYGIGDNYWGNGAPEEPQNYTGDMARAKLRATADDSDTPVPRTAKTNRGRPVAVVPQAEVKAKPKPKTRRIAVEDSDESDGGLGKIGSSSVVGAKRRANPSAARKAQLADFGMQDSSEVEGQSVPPDESSLGAGRAGDESAVSGMVAQESEQTTPTGALQHMSSLGNASLGVSKATTQNSTAKRTRAPPKKVVIMDSDSDGGGFKGFGNKRRRRVAS